MPLLQQQPDSLWGDVRSLPDPELGPHLPQQIQNRVAVLSVLQLDPMVFSRHSDTGEPAEHERKTKKATKFSSTNSLLDNLELRLCLNNSLDFI